MKFVFAVTFAMVAGTAADNCVKLTKMYGMVPHTVNKAKVSDGTTCRDNSASAAGGKGDGCGECCIEPTGTCSYLANNGQGCAATHDVDKALATASKAATAANFKTTCCKLKETCATWATCAATGMKINANASTIKCDRPRDGKTGCNSRTCCVTDATTCAGFVNGACAGTKKKDQSDSKLATAVTDAKDFETKCCVEPAKCDIVCPAGYEKKDPITTCLGNPCSLATDLRVCCKMTAATCQAQREFPGQPAMSCDTTHFDDKAKFTLAAKVGGSDYKANCCTKKDTCMSFSAANIAALDAAVGTASFAIKQQAAGSATLLLLLVGGSLA